MDIKEKIEQVLSELTKNASLKKLFDGDPLKAARKFFEGIDLPDNILETIVKGVKEKLSFDNLKDAAGDLKEKLSGDALKDAAGDIKDAAEGLFKKLF